MRTPAFFLLLAISITGAEVKITSTKDGTQQPVLLEVPEAAKTGAPVPLLVHLHSWSADYKNSGLMSEAEQGARDRGWVFLSRTFVVPMIIQKHADPILLPRTLSMPCITRSRSPTSILGEFIL